MAGLFNDTQDKVIFDEAADVPDEKLYQQPLLQPTPKTGTIIMTEPPALDVVQAEPKEETTQELLAKTPRMTEAEKSAKWQNHIAKLLNMNVNSAMTQQVYEYCKTLYKTEIFQNARNAAQALDDLIMMGLPPVKKYVNMWVLDEQTDRNNKTWHTLVVSPTAPGLVFRASLDGIIEDIDYGCVYKPDTFKPIKRGGKDDTFEWVGYEGNTPEEQAHTELLCAYCLLYMPNGNTKLFWQWAPYLEKAKKAYAKEYTDKTTKEKTFSKAWVNSEDQMYIKFIIKQALKYTLSMVTEEKAARLETIINIDNAVDWSVEQQPSRPEANTPRQVKENPDQAALVAGKALKQAGITILPPKAGEA